MAAFLTFNDDQGFSVILATDQIVSIETLNAPEDPGIEIVTKDGRRWKSTTFDVEGAATALGLEMPQ